MKELIDRRSAIYSSRHPQPMVERAGGGKRMVFMPYGKDWRAIRNIVHRVRAPRSPSHILMCHRQSFCPALVLFVRKSSGRSRDDDFGVVFPF